MDRGEISGENQRLLSPSSPRAIIMARPAFHANGLPSTSHSTPEANGPARRRSRLSHAAHFDMSREIEREQNNSSTLTLSPLVVRRGAARFSTKPEDASISVSKGSCTPAATRVAGGEEDARADDEDDLDGLERLRGWRNDAMTQHLYETAAFWGGKAWQVSGECLQALSLSSEHLPLPRSLLLTRRLPLPWLLLRRRPKRRFLASADPFPHTPICAS
jgi:hypothetical protein